MVCGAAYYLFYRDLPVCAHFAGICADFVLTCPVKSTCKRCARATQTHTCREEDLRALALFVHLAEEEFHAKRRMQKRAGASSELMVERANPHA